MDADLSAPPGERGRHPLPDADSFARAAGGAGIGAGVFVVAYGNGGGPERLWWLLRHFGHDDCAVIDFEAWRGRLVAGDEEIEPQEFVPRERDDDTIEADELARRLGELVVVDARVPSRYRGEPNRIDAKPGRIPGARNAPWNEPQEFVPRERDDDTIEADELARRLGELVVVDARVPSRYRGEPNPIDAKPGRVPGALNAPWNEPLPALPVGELVAYCGSGVTASVVLHRLHLAGREGKLYPGSWSEWEQRDLPIERG